MDSRPVFRKRGLSTSFSVSPEAVNFSCEGECLVDHDTLDTIDIIITGKTPKGRIRYGISKQEGLVSDLYGIDGLKQIVCV